MTEHPFVPPPDLEPLPSPWKPPQVAVAFAASALGTVLGWAFGQTSRRPSRAPRHR